MLNPDPLKISTCFIIFLLYLFTAQIVRAQTVISYEDSLTSKLHEQKTDKGKIFILQKLVDADPTDQNNSNSLRQLLVLNDKAHIIDAHPYLLLQKVQEYAKDKQLSAVVNSLQQVINELDKQHRVLTWYLNVMKDNYDALGDQETRLSYFQQKLQYYQVNGPFENTALCYLAIGG